MIEIVQLALLILIIAIMVTRKLPSATENNQKIILDSCALIDGRIVDIISLGFAQSQIIVPKFVLNELQLLADGQNSQKRERARFGLDAVKRIQAIDDARVIISEIDFTEATATDEKLILLAKKIHADLCTTDYNLNKVATIQGISVLNVNELSNALRAVVLPGETRQVTIVQKGSAKDQGVGYLDDGTMVVVSGASSYVGKNVTATITRMLQSDAGKMIFADMQNTKVSRTGNSKKRNSNRSTDQR